MLELLVHRASPLNRCCVCDGWASSLSNAQCVSCPYGREEHAEKKTSSLRAALLFYFLSENFRSSSACGSRAELGTRIHFIPASHSVCHCVCVLSVCLICSLLSFLSVSLARSPSFTGSLLCLSVLPIHLYACLTSALLFRYPLYLQENNECTFQD